MFYVLFTFCFEFLGKDREKLLLRRYLQLGINISPMYSHRTHGYAETASNRFRGMSFEDLRDYLDFPRRNAGAKHDTDHFLDNALIQSIFRIRGLALESVVQVAPVALRQTVNHWNDTIQQSEFTR